MPLFKRVDQLPAATGVTGSDFLILSRPSGPTGTVGTRAATLTQLLEFLNTQGGATGPTGATGVAGAASTVTGPTGVAGGAGANGAAGATGPTGASSSVAGPTGSAGATGPAGATIASGVSVANGYSSFSAVPATVEGALVAIDGVLENKADSSPATTQTLGPMRVGAGLSVESGTVSVSYGVVSSTAAQGNDARLSDSRAPNGAAGGDLTGTFPNPTIAAGAVTLAKTTGLQKTISVSTSAPTGGSSGDIHLRYTS